CRGGEGEWGGTVNGGEGRALRITRTAVSGSAGSFTVGGTHQYMEEGTYTATVTITDVGGKAATETSTITVADAALTAGTATLTGGTAGVTTTALSATFSDANLGATTADFAGTINWGDGQTSSFTSTAVSGSAGNFTVSGTHQYAAGGTYTATVTIVDDGKQTTIDTGTATVAAPEVPPDLLFYNNLIPGNYAFTGAKHASDATWVFKVDVNDFDEV